MTINKSPSVTKHTLSSAFIYFPLRVKNIKNFLKFINLKNHRCIHLVFITSVLLMPACTNHHNVHFYDGEHKDIKDLATVIDVMGEGLIVDGSSADPYLPPKSAYKRDKIDKYFVLPGKRRFVFTKKTIVGYDRGEACSTAPSSGCAFYTDDNICIPNSPVTTCFPTDIPIFKTELSKEVLLHLKSGHTYDITVSGTEPGLISVIDFEIGNTKESTYEFVVDSKDMPFNLYSGKAIREWEREQDQELEQKLELTQYAQSTQAYHAADYFKAEDFNLPQQKQKKDISEKAIREWKQLSTQFNQVFQAGDYSKAEVLAKQALTVAEREFGHDYVYTLTSMHNLALLYKAQGRFEQAEPLFVETVALMKDVLGKQHPRTLKCMNNLAELYRDQGRIE